jgi:hypothetical protein
MARANDNDEPASAGVVLPALPSMDGPEEIREILQSAFARPRLRLRILERTALIRFEDAEVLLDEAIAQELGEQLDRLAKLEGHSRTVVNFVGYAIYRAMYWQGLPGWRGWPSRRTVGSSSAGSIRSCGTCCGLPVSTGCSTAAPTRRKPWA